MPLHSVDPRLQLLTRTAAPWHVCLVHLLALFQGDARTVVDTDTGVVRLLLLDQAAEDAQVRARRLPRPCAHTRALTRT